MADAAPPIVTFVAPSGTGKTTVLERVCGVLVGRGVRVGVIKHHAHPIELDTPGKDTWRLRQVGSRPTVLLGHDQLAVFGRGSDAIDLQALARLLFAQVDLVLGEGLRGRGLPTIQVVRGPVPADWAPVEPPIALVADGEVVGAPVPVLPLARPEAVADFLMEHFLPAARSTATAGVPRGGRPSG